MIRYGGTFWGFGLIFRMHGSAVAKAIPVSFVSTIMYFMMYYISGVSFANQSDWKVTAHPYPIGALVAAFTFLLVFRANYSYVRVSEFAFATTILSFSVLLMRSSLLYICSNSFSFSLSSFRFIIFYLT